MLPCATERPLLGEILVQHQVVEAWMVEEALQRQQVEGGRLGEALVRAGHCRPGDVAEGLAHQAAPPDALAGDPLEAWALPDPRILAPDDDPPRMLTGTWMPDPAIQAAVDRDLMDAGVDPGFADPGETADPLDLACEDAGDLIVEEFPAVVEEPACPLQETPTLAYGAKLPEGLVVVSGAEVEGLRREVERLREDLRAAEVAVMEAAVLRGRVATLERLLAQKDATPQPQPLPVLAPPPLPPRLSRSLAPDWSPEQDDTPPCAPNPLAPETPPALPHRVRRSAPRPPRPVGTSPFAHLLAEATLSGSSDDGGLEM
jgi:hypothetical protein